MSLQVAGVARQGHGQVGQGLLPVTEEKIGSPQQQELEHPAPGFSRIAVRSSFTCDEVAREPLGKVALILPTPDRREGQHRNRQTTIDSARCQGWL